MAHDSVPASVKIAPPPEELERPALVENNRSIGCSERLRQHLPTENMLGVMVLTSK